MADPLHDLSAALAGRYTIERELGRGGMATVWLATDRKHQRQVALKVLRPELAAALGPERFLREITLTAGLHHPHILPLLDSGSVTEGGTGAGLRPSLYYTMPYVVGESLQQRLSRERQLPVDEALRLTREVAEALDYAHRHGIVHRDIKPANILLEEGHALVADFGIAKAVTAAGASKLTETGMVVGTPAYMSPEQGAGDQEIDGRSDIYSLGCVLYELLSGETPYTGPTPMAIIAKKLSEPTPRVSVVRETVPVPVEAALTRALAKVPADRYRTAGDFAAALTTESSAIPARRTRPSRLRYVAAGAVVVLAAIVSLIALTQPGSASKATAASLFPYDSTRIAVFPFQLIGVDSGSPARDLAGSAMGTLFEMKVPEQLGRRIAHPGSVLEWWRAAGGSADSALSESQELALGRKLGVGAFVRGTAVVSDSTITLAARMVDATTGQTRVPVQRVTGQVHDRFALVDQLMVLLLSREQGWSDAAGRALARYQPEAVQAYLAGNRAQGFSDEQKRLYRTALQYDSSLVEAALWTFAAGEQPADTVELRYALQHQEQLSERARAYARVLAGKRFSTFRSAGEVRQAYEDIARRWPEWEAPWVELGLWQFVEGALSGVPDWRGRARDAFEHVQEPGTVTLMALADLAFLDEDTVRARQLTARVARLTRGGNWVGTMPAVFPWRLAVLVGDTAAAARAIDSMPYKFFVMSYAYADGRGVEGADRVMPFLEGHPIAPIQWSMARGRYREFRQRWDRLRPWSRPRFAISVLYNALFLGVPEDSATTMALETLDGVATPAPRAPAAAADERAMAVFWTTLWRLSRSDTSSATGAIGYLHREADRWGQLTPCAMMLEVLLARVKRGDVRDLVLRLDSAVRSLPVPTGSPEWIPSPVEVQNLFLARELARIGEPERALAASRRRLYGGYAHFTMGLLSFLREEGRLAAATGDAAGAVRAYQHYLALRADPEPPWRTEWNEVRSELAALAGR